MYLRISIGSPDLPSTRLVAPGEVLTFESYNSAPGAFEVFAEAMQLTDSPGRFAPMLDGDDAIVYRFHVRREGCVGGTSLQTWSWDWTQPPLPPMPFEIVVAPAVASERRRIPTVDELLGRLAEIESERNVALADVTRERTARAKAERVMMEQDKTIEDLVASLSTTRATLRRREAELEEARSYIAAMGRDRFLVPEGVRRALMAGQATREVMEWAARQAGVSLTDRRVEICRERARLALGFGKVVLGAVIPELSVTGKLAVSTLGWLAGAAATGFVGRVIDDMCQS
jgi:hypothetical protein